MAPRPPSIAVGDVIGRWTVINGPELRQRYNQRSTMVQVRCECGTERWARPVELRVSCGCYQQEVTSKRTLKHGKSFTRLHKLWRSVRARCNTPSCTGYSNYGARGITVCAEWDDFKAFETWALASGWRSGLQLDRIDNDGDYEPSNCRFVTGRQNMRNTRVNRPVTAWGETKLAIEWLEDQRCVVTKKGTFTSRLDLGWSPEAALTTPVRPKKVRSSA